MQILCTFFGFLPTSFEIFFSALGNIGGDSKWVVAKEVNGKMFYKLINVLWSYFSIFKHCVSLIRSHMVCAVAYLLNTTSSQTSFATIKKKEESYFRKLSLCTLPQYSNIGGDGKWVVAKEVCEEVVRKKYATARTMWLLLGLTQCLKIEKY